MVVVAKAEALEHHCPQRPPHAQKRTEQEPSDAPQPEPLPSATSQPSVQDAVAGLVAAWEAPGAHGAGWHQRFAPLPRYVRHPTHCRVVT